MPLPTGTPTSSTELSGRAVNWSFCEYDGMGSVRQLTNSAGAVTDTYEYDAFGNLLNKTGTTPNEMLYRGEQWDSDLGLYYLRARWYDPQSGRFMSRDPRSGQIRTPATLHRYLYADGDPINMVDPTGQGALDEFALIGDVIIQRTIPAVVEFVGDFVELNVINPAKDAAEIVAEYAQDAQAVLATHALARWFACDELGALSADVFIDITDSSSSEKEKEFEKEQAARILDKACGLFLFHEPINPFQ